MEVHEHTPQHMTAKAQLVDILCSLKFAIALVILVVATVCSTVSFVPLYLNAMDAADTMAHDYMNKVSSDVNRSVSAYFGASQTVVSTMAGGSRLGGFQRNDTTSVLRWLAYGTSLAGADLVSFIFDEPFPLWTGALVSPSYQIAPAGTFFATRYNETHGNVSLLNVTTLESISTTTVDLSAPFRTRPYFPIIRNRQGWGTSFIGIVLGKSESVLPCGAPLVDLDGNGVGAMYLRTRQNIIEDYLDGLSIATSGRAMLVDPQNGLLVATSSLVDSSILQNGSSYRVALYTDVRDALLSSVVAALGIWLLSCDTPCVRTTGSGSSSVYVMVTSVNDTFNLNKRLVVAVPSEDFLQEIRSGMEVSIYLSSIVGAVLVVLGILAVMTVTRPLDDLQRRLHCSKRLEGLDVDTTPQSQFTEIRSIETAFDKLRIELKKLRSFLPQSLLELVGDSSSSDENSIHILEQHQSEEAEGTALDPSGNCEILPSAEGAFDGPRQHRRRRNSFIQDSLKTEFVLVSRRVTVVISNVKGFHALLERIGPLELHKFHSELLSAALQKARDTGGVVQNVSGDHFFIGWNAASQRKTHVSAAARFVHDMQLELRAAAGGGGAMRHVCVNRNPPANSTYASEYDSDRKSLRVVFGVATGVALCGNFGCDLLKQPAIVGPVVQQAFALVHQCSAEHTVALFNEEAARVVRDEFLMLHWNYVVLPQDSRPSILSLLIGLVPGDPNHQTRVAPPLLTAEEENARQCTNSAFEAFARGRFSVASDFVSRAEMPGQTWMTEGIQRALRFALAAESNSTTL